MNFINAVLFNVRLFSCAALSVYSLRRQSVHAKKPSAGIHTALFYSIRLPTARIEYKMNKM